MYCLWSKHELHLVFPIFGVDVAALLISISVLKTVWEDDCPRTRVLSKCPPRMTQSHLQDWGLSGKEAECSSEKVRDLLSKHDLLIFRCFQWTVMPNIQDKGRLVVNKQQPTADFEIDFYIEQRLFIDFLSI